VHERCYEEARNDYWLLNPVNTKYLKLEGGTVTKVYCDAKDPHIINGLIVQDMVGAQYLIVPAAPDGNIKKSDQGWLTVYRCGIPKPFTKPRKKKQKNTIKGVGFTITRL
jgi:hypothetical protein